MDLSLYDDHVRPELPSGGLRLFRRSCDDSAGNRNPVFLEQGLALIFMNFHRFKAKFYRPHP
jgi:hypothetical protein